MEPNYNDWLVKDLLEYLSQYNIDKTDIRGTGKNGNVVKKDLIRAIKKIKRYSNNIINNDIQYIENNEYDIIPIDVIPQILYNLPVQKSRLINKQTLLENQDRYIKRNYAFLTEKGTTPNLKMGDFVLYRGPEYNGDVIAIVYKVISANRVKIRALQDYNDMINTDEPIDVDRKNLTIIKLDIKYLKSLPTNVQMSISLVNPRINTNY
jgi:hypothetical protein